MYRTYHYRCELFYTSGPLRVTDHFCDQTKSPNVWLDFIVFGLKQGNLSKKLAC
uniref:Uncharacterized protein n=1 Tax=Romanomermis culicivorax TaxID=13658 RepID=A0A915IAP9_ROMCU